MANPIMSVLKPYVDQEANKESLIAKTVLGAKSAGLFTLQTGVKGPTTINLLNSSVVFGDGTTCGFDEAGSVTVSQRQIKPAILKVNMSFCEKNLLGTYAQYKVKLEAGMESMPWEEEFTRHIVDSVKAKIEEMIYLGDSSQTAPQFDGLLKTLGADGALVATTGSSKWATIKNVYEKLPEVAHAEDTAILVSAPVFRAFIQELVAANMYHYDGNDTPMEYTLPGTSVKVIAVNGLNNATTYDIVAGRLGHIFYGTDLANSEEDFKLVYDEVNEVWMVKILFSAGVQVAFPTECVLAKA